MKKNYRIYILVRMAIYYRHWYTFRIYDMVWNNPVIPDYYSAFNNNSLCHS